MRRLIPYPNRPRALCSALSVCRVAFVVVSGGERSGTRQREDQWGVPVDRDLIHGVRALVIHPHAHGRLLRELAGYGVAGMGIGPAREKAGPWRLNMIGGAGSVMRVHEGTRSDMSN